jgi:hypothetical protein
MCISYRIIAANMNRIHDDMARPDALHFYSSVNFDANSFIGMHLGIYGYVYSLFAVSIRNNTTGTMPVPISRGSVLGVHMRATAADSRFGFIAEVTVIPGAPMNAPITSVSVRDSRFVRNDRGAVHLTSAGDAQAPTIKVDQCFLADNGQRVWANLSTSDTALYVHAPNTRVGSIHVSSKCH